MTTVNEAVCYGVYPVRVRRKHFLMWIITELFENLSRRVGKLYTDRLMHPIGLLFRVDWFLVVVSGEMNNYRRHKKHAAICSPISMAKERTWHLRFCPVQEGVWTDRYEAFLINPLLRSRQMGSTQLIDWLRRGENLSFGWYDWPRVSPVSSSRETWTGEEKIILYQYPCNDIRVMERRVLKNYVAILKKAIRPYFEELSLLPTPRRRYVIFVALLT